MRFLLITFLTLFTFSLHAGTDADERELRELLDAFMAGASVNDAEVHERFWADDLVYTSSSGERFGKARIMDGLVDAGSADEEPAVVYSARDVDVRLFGELAVITFRLIGAQAGTQGRFAKRARNPEVEPSRVQAGDDTLYYFNTGVFEKRDGRWQAVAWHATRAADTPETE